MYSASRWLVLGVVALCVRWASSSPTALSIQPSTGWYGVDGSWSTITIGVGTGTPRQWMNVMVSTVSSETWVVGAGGCGSVLTDSSCINSRGNLFFPYNSSTWQGVGRYNLGADEVLGNYGYADYGVDSLTLGTYGSTVSSTIIGAFNGTDTINTTYYLTGFLGLGVVDGTFNNTAPTPLSALNALVQTADLIPSHSYGYTAGASYQQKGEPMSLTLGGYDSARFTPHNVTFGLNPSQLPQTYLEGISMTSALASSNLTNSNPLLTTVDRVNAIIDSSTPYLWLPQSVCERFASALGLVYDDALNLYTFGGNESNHDTLAKSQLSFTFSLADMASSNSTVNITVPYAAFDLQLTWPAIPNTNYGDVNATRNYFPLRQASNDAQYRIGRAFLQEAYIITDYERNFFAVYQAVHPADPLGTTDIQTIARSSDSIFAGPPAKSSRSSISSGAIAGIAVGAVVLIVLLVFAFLFFRRRRSNQKKGDESDEKPLETIKPRTLFDRLLRRSREPPVHEASGCTNYPTEVAADATHERFELPAPLGPAELDSDSGTWDGTTENGTQDSANLSAYERARRKLERQQAAARAQSAHETYPIEKSEVDVSPVVHYRPPTRDIESPLVSPVADSPHSLTMDGQPSPVSPGFVSALNSPMEPPPMYRRINPTNVVYAGRLPDNVQLPAVVPRLIGPDGRTVRSVESVSTEPSGTNSSLGSHFTEHEDAARADLYSSGDTNIVSPIASGSNGSGSASGSVDTNIVSPIASTSTGSSDSRGFHVRGGSEIEIDRNPSSQSRESDPWPSRRRLGGEDLIHVPQPAENRFSWEEEKISGHEDRASL